MSSVHSCSQPVAQAKRPSARLVFALAMAALAIPPAAASDSGLSETDLLGPIPELSIVSHFPQTAARAPASTTVITGDMLRTSGAMNWVDVFRLVPGFQAYAPNANRFGIDYHGQGRDLPNHLEVMVDGRSVYDPVQSTVIWGTLGIDLDDIERIEVVRGPSAAAHGSNAFSGAVNIITRAPLDGEGTRLRVAGGDRDTGQASLRNSGQLGELGYRLSLGFDRNDGFPDFNALGPDDGAETWSANLRTTYAPTLVDTFSFDGGFSRHDTEFGDADRLDLYIPMRDYSQYQRVAWDRRLDGGDDLQVTFYRNHLRANGTRDFGLLSTVLGITPDQVQGLLGFPDQHYIDGFHTLESERLDLEALRRGRTDSLSWAWGAGAREERVDSIFFTAQNGAIDEQMFRLFGHGEWTPWARWSLSAGTMVEKTSVGVLVSPRASAAYEFVPDQTLRLSGARGRRAPSITEAHERQVAFLQGAIVDDIRRTSDLDDERIDSIELAYLARLPELGIDFDIKLFRESGKDGMEDYLETITAVPPFFDDQRLVRDNFSHWDTTGAEMQLFCRMSPSTWARLHYAYQDIDSFYIKSFAPVFETRDYDGGAPRHSGGLLFNHRWSERFDGGFFVYYQSRVDWRNGDPFGEITRVDAQLTWHFQLGASPGQLQLVAQNIGGDYHEFNRQNQFETALYLRAKIDLPD